MENVLAYIVTDSHNIQQCVITT